MISVSSNKETSDLRVPGRMGGYLIDTTTERCEVRGSSLNLTSPGGIMVKTGVYYHGYYWGYHGYYWGLLLGVTMVTSGGVMVTSGVSC